MIPYEPNLTWYIFCRYKFVFKIYFIFKAIKILILNFFHLMYEKLNKLNFKNNNLTVTQFLFRI